MQQEVTHAESTIGWNMELAAPEFTSIELHQIGPVAFFLATGVVLSLIELSIEIAINNIVSKKSERKEKKTYP